MQFIDKFLSMVKEMLPCYYQDLYIYVIIIITQEIERIHSAIQNSGKRGFDYYILVFNINYGDYGPIHCQQHNIR